MSAKELSLLSSLLNVCESTQLRADQPRAAEMIFSPPASKMFPFLLLLLSLGVRGLSSTNLWCGHCQEWNKSFSTVDLMSLGQPLTSLSQPQVFSKSGELERLLG